MHTQNEKELIEKMLQMQQQIDECKKEIQDLKEIINTDTRKKINRVPTPQKPSQVNTFENFVGLKLIHFIGIIVLFIGLSIGVKYAIDINLISPFLRIALAYTASIVLLLLSLKLFKKYDLFSMILFSGAVATFYFTTYGAYEYYSMIPYWLAFAIMLSLTVFTVYVALKYNRPVIAKLGLVGAYAIPFFVRGAESNITNLLSYILVINLGVLFISLKKYWLSLNYIAFFSTWLIYFGSLYLDNYDKKFSQSLLLFSFIYFTLFTISTLAFKIYKKYAVAIEDAGLLSINVVFLYSALNIVAQRISENGSEYLTLYFSIGLLIAGIACRYLIKAQHFLTNCLYAMGITALASFAALHFKGFTITIIWVIMAIVLFVAGMLLRLKVLRIVSILLFGATILKLLLFDSSRFSAVQKVIAYIFTGAVLLVVSFLYQRFKGIIFGKEE